MPSEYVVQPGDNMSRIAAHHGMSWRELFAFDGGTGRPNSARLRSGDASRIFPGEVLLVPDRSESTPGQVDEHPELAPPGGLGAILHHFDTNSDVPKPEHIAWLKENVIPLLIAGGTVDSVVGDASPLGSTADNLALSKRRAESIARFLRLRLSDEGLEDPLAVASPQGDGEHRARNQDLVETSDDGFFRAVRITTSAAKGAEAEGDDDLSIGPVGQGDYIVRKGECIASIAKKKGFYWETIWHHGDNADLKLIRRNPNILLPRDRVTLPPKNRKEEPRETEARHRFRLRGEPVKLHLQFLRNGQPLANAPYKLILEGDEEIGTLDAKGELSKNIPADATRAQITVGEEGAQTTHNLRIGDLNPITELSGVQHRLRNLGFGCPQERSIGKHTRSAVKAFQQSKTDIEPNGRPDRPTRKEILRRYGC